MGIILVMRGTSVRSVVNTALITLIASVILLLPFHAFLTVWTASNFGHYTLLRLWKEFLVLICALIVIGIAIADQKVRTTILKNKLSWAVLAYAGWDLIDALIAYHGHSVSGKALAYGLLDDLRFEGFFIICWAAALRSRYLGERWQKLILWPAAIVVAFGVLQMSVLPAGVLAHFGYGPSTILPFQLINNNPDYVRILSTLRGADPLGAYLILPISALLTLLLFFPRSWNWLKLAFLAAALTVLVGSYSRGAWAGAILACLVAAGVWVDKKRLVRYKKQLVGAAVALVLIIAAAAITLSQNTHFQNIFFHTQTNSSVSSTSDQQHLSAVKNGISALAHHPLGEGPGSSGPASVYNRDRPARVPENYFLEVGEESGWLGLLLFLTLNGFMGYELWQRRRSPFALTLFASFIGITFVNLLTLSWTDDTLSYIWWGLAGLCLGIPDASVKTTGKRVE